MFFRKIKMLLLIAGKDFVTEPVKDIYTEDIILRAYLRKYLAADLLILIYSFYQSRIIKQPLF